LPPSFALHTPSLDRSQVTRQKLPVDWHARLQAIQARSAQAAKELPPGLLASLPGADGTAVDYFRARAVRDKLAQDGERSLFGGLTGQAGVWDKIVRAYENGGAVTMEDSSSTCNTLLLNLLLLCPHHACPCACCLMLLRPGTSCTTTKVAETIA
jgi:CDK5 regulatory subunit-associated protein 3